MVIKNTSDNKKISKGNYVETMNPISEHTAFEIMKKAFKDMGCQLDVNDDNSISLAYQGENFFIESQGYNVRVWDPSWYSINASSPDLRNIREAVNEANYSFGPTIVLSKPDNEGNIFFHSRRDIIIHPSLPEPALYMKSVLDTFFIIKDVFKEEFNKMDVEQKQYKKDRHPIGFNTYNR